MGLQLPFGIDPTNPISVDVRYGPWASLAAAKAAVPLALRYDGLTVQITGSGEYHWLASDLTDTGLIVKKGSTPPGGTVHQVYLVNDSTTATAMGGAANNVYNTAQNAYDAANTLQKSLPFGTVVQIMVGSTRQADVGDINLPVLEGWNNYITVVGIDTQTSQIRDIIGDDAFGVQGITLYNVLVNSLKGRSTTPTVDAPGVALSGNNFAVNTIDTSLTNASNSGTTGYINISGSGYVGTITSTTVSGFLGGLSIIGPVTSNSINISGNDDSNGLSLQDCNVTSFSYVQITSTIPTNLLSFLRASIGNLIISIAGGSQILIEDCKIDQGTFTNVATSLGSVIFMANRSLLSSTLAGGIFNFTDTATANYARLHLTECTFHYIYNLPASSFLFNCTIYTNIQGIGASCQIVTSSIQGGPTVTPLASFTNPTAVTVISNGSYFRGAPASTVTVTNVNYTPITKSALSTLISTSKLLVGTTYFITDSQDGGTVAVTASSLNTLNQSGKWIRLTQNKPFGSFILSAGSAGSIDQVAVGATNLMTASVPYITSRFQTLTNVATNINAHSGVSGYRAVVIQGEAILDEPAMVIEQTTPGVNTSAIAVTTTTLTASQVSVMGMGIAQVTQTLDIDYDLTTDRVTRCFDITTGCSMTYTPAEITTLGHNPITEFRWGHPNFINWNIIGTDYTNVFITSTTSGINQIEQNNTIVGGSFKNVILRRTTVSFLSLSNNSNLNFSNVQGAQSFRCNGNTCGVTLTSVTSPNFTITGNTGNGIINLGTANFTTSVSISTNSVRGGIIIFGANFSLLTFSCNNNSIGGSLSFASATTFTQNITISSNVIEAGLTLPSGGTYNFAISIVSSKMMQASLQSYSTSATGGISINSCEFAPVSSIQGAWTGTALLLRSKIGTSLALYGPTAGSLAVTDCLLEGNDTPSAWNFASASSVILLRAKISGNTSILLTGTGTFNITDSKLHAVTINTGTLSINGSDLVYSFINATNFQMDSCTVKDTSFGFSAFGYMSISTSTFHNCTMVLDDDGISNLPTTLTNVHARSSSITVQCNFAANPGQSTMNNCVFEGSSFGFNFSGGLGINNSINGLKMFNSSLSESGSGNTIYAKIDNCIIDNCPAIQGNLGFLILSSTKLKDIQFLSLPSENIRLRGTTIDNGTYRIKYNWNFNGGGTDTNTTIVAGTASDVTDLLPGFSFKRIIYGGGFFNPGGQSLQMGHSATYDQYIPSTPVAGFPTSVESVGFVAAFAALDTLKIKSTVADTSAGRLFFTIEGNYSTLNDWAVV